MVSTRVPLAVLIAIVAMLLALMGLRHVSALRETAVTRRQHLPPHAYDRAPLKMPQKFVSYLLTTGEALRDHERRIEAGASV